MLLGEDQRSFVMQTLTVGGRERGGDRRRRGRWATGYKVPLLALSLLCWRSPQHTGEIMRNMLPKMMAALMCMLSAYADVMPVQDFDLEKV